MNTRKIEEYIRAILIEIGEDPDREGLIDTPRRVVDRIKIGTVEELVELMLDAICSTKPYQQINGEAVPTQVVKSRLLKVRYEHIQYVFFSLDRSTSKAKNIRQYMLRFLIKLPFRIIAASVWLVLAAVNIVLVKSQ